jgi:hypothetical protein
VYLRPPFSRTADVIKYAGLSEPKDYPTALKDGWYICPSVRAYLYSQPEFKGFFGEYFIPEASLELSTGINHLGITYNDGKPCYNLYTYTKSFNFSDVIPVAEIYFFDGKISVAPYAVSGQGLAEKINSLNALSQFAIYGHYNIGSDGLHVWVSSLTAGKNGLPLQECEAIDTGASGTDMYLFYLDDHHKWQYEKVTGINNQSYQDSAGGLSPLLADEYVVNYIYRLVSGTANVVFVLLSGKYDSEQDALADVYGEIPPEIIESSAVCIGRMIIKFNEPTPAVIQKVKKIIF